MATTTPVRTFKTAEDCNIVMMANGDLAYGHMTTGGTARVTPASYLLVRIIEKATRFTVYLGKSLPTAFQGELNLGVASNLQFATVASLEAAHDLLGSDSPLVETTEAPAQVTLDHLCRERITLETVRLECRIKDAQDLIEFIVRDHENRLKISLQAAEREAKGEARLAQIREIFANMHRTGVAPRIKDLEAQIEKWSKLLKQLA